MPDTPSTESPEDKGDATPSDSSPENNNKGDAGTQAGGESPKVDEFKDLPFHEHPRWKQREQEWNERFEKQEQAMQEKIATAVATALQANKPQASSRDEVNAIAEGPIPVWFGGGADTPEVRKMWKEYVDQQSRILSDAEKRAEEKAFERLNQSKQTESQAIQEANKWFDESITKIEATYGKRVDRNELLKYVLENQIIDHTTQRWDYLKGYRWLMAEKGTPIQTNQGGMQDRKTLAGMTTKDSGKGSEGGEKSFTTSDDFRDPSKRPW